MLTSLSLNTLIRSGKLSQAPPFIFRFWFSLEAGFITFPGGCRFYHSSWTTHPAELVLSPASVACGLFWVANWENGGVDRLLYGGEKHADDPYVSLPSLTIVSIAAAATAVRQDATTNVWTKDLYAVHRCFLLCLTTMFPGQYQAQVVLF